MPDKIVNHFVLADGSVARYDYESLLNAPDIDDADVNKYIDGFDDIADWVQETNITAVDGVTWTIGYKQSNGTVASNTQYVYSSIIPVLEGDTVEVCAVTSGGSTRQYIRFQCAYNGETVVTSAGSNTQTNTYIVPEGIDGLSVTVASTYVNILEVRITRTTEHAEVTGLSELDTRVDALEEAAGFSNKNAFISVTDDAMTSGDVLKIEDARCSVKKSARLVFECTGVPTTLYIGMASETTPALSNMRQVVKLDGTNLSYRNGTAGDFNSVAHGLTLSDNVQIIIETKPLEHLWVTVISDGVAFKNRWNSSVGGCDRPAVILESGTVTDAKLTWTSTDIKKMLWVFGDSYVSLNSSVRWPYYLDEYDYENNILLDGYSGEPSSRSIIDVTNLLACATPKYILWALGMNDGSDSSTAPSTNWATYRDQFITFCEDNVVTPIFATIPTVPTVNNEKKNEWVRNSGYRFVDFAKAVGADGTGAWFSGMLSSDNVHPTEQGAKALFARVLLDLPEIMIGD